MKIKEFPTDSAKDAGDAGENESEKNDIPTLSPQELAALVKEAQEKNANPTLSPEELAREAAQSYARNEAPTPSTEDLSQDVERAKKQLTLAIERQRSATLQGEELKPRTKSVAETRSATSASIAVVLSVVIGSAGGLGIAEGVHYYLGQKQKPVAPLASAVAPEPSASSEALEKPSKIVTPEDLAANILVPATQGDFFPTGIVTNKYYEMLQQNADGKGWHAVTVKSIQLPNGMTGKNVNSSASITIAVYKAADPAKTFRVFDPYAKQEGKSIIKVNDKSDPHVSYYYLPGPVDKGCAQFGFSMGKSGSPERATDFHIGQCFEGK